MVNGDVATVAGLIANPGPDGISLREALAATNNDQGSYAIGFAPSLAGTTITLEALLPTLTGGGVTIEGDIDGDGQPDVTLRPGSRSFPPWAWGLRVSSSGNRLHALTLEGFITGVQLQSEGQGLPNHRTFADNVVSDLVINGGDGTNGIGIFSLENPECNSVNPCPTYDRWTKTTVTGNTIETRQFGMCLCLGSIGDRIEHVTVTGNTIRQGTSAAPARGGPAIMVSEGLKSTQTLMSDVLIARNAIEGVNGDGGIFVASGLQRAQANAIDGVRILDNRVHLVKEGAVPCCFAIVVVAGSDTWAVNARPVNYPSDNVVRNVHVAGNTVSGSLAAGVRVMAGTDAGGSRNRVESVRVERNVIRSTMVGKGVYLWVGDILPFEGTYATGNRICRVTIAANRITTGNRNPLPGETNFRTAGGIVLLGGWHYSRGGVVRGIRIRKNRIVTAQAGIRLIGGIGRTARGNSVTCVRLAGNRITGTRNAVVVTPNVAERPKKGPVGRASGNRASLGGC